MRKAVIGLGLFLVAACSGSSEKDDSESGGPASSGGENESGGSSTQESGGSTSAGGDAATSTGGTGATSTGGNASGGSPRGGATQGGTTSSGGSGAQASGASGASGEGGTAAGMAGSSTTGGVNASGSGGRSGASGTSGTSGTSGVNPTCDPVSGELDSTPYPDCAPRDPSDRCELCVESNCCEQVKDCYGYELANVCGWGGPSSGAYAGLNEVDCFVACVRNYVEAYGTYDDAADDRCIPACTTEPCGLIGNATQDLIACMRETCEDDCFVP